MTGLADMEARIAATGAAPGDDAPAAAAELLRLGEVTLEQWVRANGETPTDAKREGFRLLALHRQGAKGDPSFNACRETCRELIYHHNLIAVATGEEEKHRLLGLARRITLHLYLFVAGKLEDQALGDFCCSSRDSHRAVWQRDRQMDSQEGAKER